MKRSASSSNSKGPQAAASLDEEKNVLVRGILDNARSEARKIEVEAERAFQERLKAAGSQVKALQRETDERIREQTAAIERDNASSIAIETHRIALRNRERIVHEVQERVKRRLEGLSGKPEYRDILVGWIVEAMIGLGVEKASVNASADEMRLIDRPLLTEAEERVRELTGRRVRLEKSGSAPLLARGVVLEAEGGRLMFNNQVPTRMLRYQSQIRKLITDALER